MDEEVYLLQYFTDSSSDSGLECSENIVGENLETWIRGRGVTDDQLQSEGVVKCLSCFLESVKARIKTLELESAMESAMEREL